MTVGPDAVVIVRHGQTEWSANGRHTGRTDLPLTESGMVEALGASSVLFELLGGADPGVVLTSPRTRARVTARLALGSLGETAIVDDRIAEFDYGDLEGLTTAEIHRRLPGWSLWRDGCPGGESPESFAARIDSFVEDLCERDVATAVVFGHGHQSRGLTARMLGLPIDAAGSLWNDTASCAVLRRRGGAWVLTAWNVRPHGATVRPGA
jgi:broad specificity phosphatase PhoE